MFATVEHALMSTWVLTSNHLFDSSTVRDVDPGSALGGPGLRRLRGGGLIPSRRKFHSMDWTLVGQCVDAFSTRLDDAAEPGGLPIPSRV